MRAIVTEPAIVNSFSIERFEKCIPDTSFTRLSYRRILLVESGTGTLTIDKKILNASSLIASKLTLFDV